MEFGLNFFPDVGPEEKSAQDYWHDALALTALVDDLGFGHVRTVEHYFHRYGGYSPNPLLYLAAASQRSRKARLYTGALLPVFNHPIKLASEIAEVDALSGGRLEVGFARAFLPHEFRRMGRSMDESRARFDEGVAMVQRLLTEENVRSIRPGLGLPPKHLPQLVGRRAATVIARGTPMSFSLVADAPLSPSSGVRK